MSITPPEDRNAYPFKSWWETLGHLEHWTPPKEWEGSAFATRRMFFERHRKTHNEGHWACPVCGYPTLGNRQSHDMCRVCQWECEGQDDPDADEAWGSGPNHGVSLSQARRNFEATRSMWPPEEAVRGGPHRFDALFSEAALASKNELCALLDGLMALESPQDIARQWQLIGTAWKRLP
ncbi:MAG: hypothetical protein ABT03_08450 [Comamonas sp. SCN 67-35]|uniref:CPCC family cysteine-rich protein n=1 Tax=unclassified Comamonas TaxID=2638500 RepID=UPI00086EA68E|nr:MULTISPECIES: CPCC family cysteine-rich protein [unclassified Comamonas]MBN9329087.1 hypothetical protein [Comamonas sp.]ODU38770.1 MAG: hypothetical protein ABT03_08450 [Comamonas sp. SCN 67-35]OJX01807.1 MAG: hypothetical protein BGO73_01665 [Burkholderiales bacterium 66-26]